MTVSGMLAPDGAVGLGAWQGEGTCAFCVASFERGSRGRALREEHRQKRGWRGPGSNPYPHAHDGSLWSV